MTWQAEPATRRIHAEDAAVAFDDIPGTYPAARVDTESWQTVVAVSIVVAFGDDGVAEDHDDPDTAILAIRHPRPSGYEPALRETVEAADDLAIVGLGCEQSA